MCSARLEVRLSAACVPLNGGGSSVKLTRGRRRRSPSARTAGRRAVRRSPGLIKARSVASRGRHWRCATGRLLGQPPIWPACRRQSAHPAGEYRPDHSGQGDCVHSTYEDRRRRQPPRGYISTICRGFRRGVDANRDTAGHRPAAKQSFLRRLFRRHGIRRWEGEGATSLGGPRRARTLRVWLRCTGAGV